MNNNELYHYGVKGMKWGVRNRYEGKYGSYTQKGVERFNKSSNEYDNANEVYNTLKQKRKENKNSVSKKELKNARLVRKQAKAQMKKDYKHLKQDKLGDQGKELYATGHTISDGERFVENYTRYGSLGLSVALYTSQYADVKTKGAIYAGAAAAVGVGGLLNARRRYVNKRLRAYYAHSSNY